MTFFRLGTLSPQSTWIRRYLFEQPFVHVQGKSPQQMMNEREITMQAIEQLGEKFRANHKVQKW